MDHINPEEEISELNGDDVDNEEQKHLCDDTIIKLVRLRPENSLNRRNLCNNNNNIAHMTSFPSTLEINAMSVVSLYEDDYAKEMGMDDDLNRKTKSNMTLDNLQDLELGGSCDNANVPQSSANLNGKNVPNDASHPFEHTNDLSSSLFFIDGLRSIDFVCVWSIDEDEETEESRAKRRLVFEENLENEGLQLEREIVKDELHFVKIHAPIEVLRRYAEILRLRMPMKEIPGFERVSSQTTTIYSQVKGTWNKIRNRILVDERHFPKKSQRFTAVYSRDKEYLFDLDKPSFFTAEIRSRIVKFILDRIRFSSSTDGYTFGIDRLISDGVYLAAYPLHDGEIHVKGSMRNLLSYEWASISKWYRYQPIDYIKDYFGVKIGLYFAWLGYYTYMLMLASIFGICCFLYSLLTMYDDKPSQDICSGDVNIMMCPLCDYWCDYWDLKQTCIHVRTSYLFNNSTTVIFAVFMSFWATLFLELWKRYSAEITHRWDLTGFDIHEEHPRPEYLARLANVKKIRIDYVTNSEEPHPPFWRMKLPATVFSFTIVMLLVSLAFAAVLGVVLYRMSVMMALADYDKSVDTTTAIWFTTATAASINLCLIVFFNWVYTYLAEYLTEFELLRTQTEFDDSLTLKIYLLQFVNYYASIFYIAFFKGKFVGYPGNYNLFLGIRQEECGLGGCLMELCIQLAIIMVGKQAMNTILEMLLPQFYKWFNAMTVWKSNKSGSTKKDTQRWLRDFKLIEWGSRSLFSEYLEMVLQYGFVTIFVAAFPLAPFFALLNNILEMRLDAQKLLTFYRRPVTQRVRNIGVWYRILDSIGKLSVITNGFIIAFTTDYVPRMVYRFHVSDNRTLDGYLNHSLSYFNTVNFNNSGPHKSVYNLSVCRYPDYREPPNSDRPYELTLFYYTVLAARVCFVVIFENVVALVMIIVRWCIPDMSGPLRDQIRREAYITNEIIIQQESMKTKSETNHEEPDAEKRKSQASHTKLAHLLKNTKLSRSDLDLVIHGDMGIQSEHESPSSPTSI